MKKSSIMILSIILVVTMILAACSSKTPANTDSDEETKVFKLGHIAAPNTAYDDFAQEFKRLIEERSNGRYKLDIYPAAQLGGDRELTESIQIGNIDFAITTATTINQFVPEMAVQDLPYLFKSWAHVEKFLDSDAAKEFYALTNSAGITTLTFMPRGFRHVTTNNKPIYSPSDLRGLKLRVAESAMYIDTFNALGANTQAMAWGEVFTALQQNTIDAHENTVVTIRDYKINEVQKNVSETGHFFAFASLLVNPSLLDSMSADDQIMVRKAGIEAAKTLGLVQKENEELAKAELESLGMVFNEVNDKEEFEVLMQPIYDKFLKSNGDTFFNKIKALE